MQIEELEIVDLIPDPQNARSHDEANIKAIAGSLRQFGQRKPVVISKENIIVAGNGTVEAAKSLGWSKVSAVRVPEDWSETKIKAFALADNRTAELALWDAEVLSSQLIELENAGIEVAEFGFVKDEVSDEIDFADALEGQLGEKGEIEQITFTLHNSQAEYIREALEVAKDLGEFNDELNRNSNGNAISRIVEMWMGQHVG